MKTGEYTTRIEARQAELLALERAAIVEPIPDYDALFIADDNAMEDRVEEEILATFGGYDAMVQAVETELAGKCGMSAAEAIVHLLSLENH